MPKQAVDLSEFMQLAKQVGRVPCQIGKVLPLLSEEERAQLTAAIADHSIPLGKGISRWLKVRGHTVHHQAIFKHRERSCQCYD